MRPIDPTARFQEAGRRCRGFCPVSSTDSCGLGAVACVWSGAGLRPQALAGDAFSLARYLGWSLILTGIAVVAWGWIILRRSRQASRDAESVSVNPSMEVREQRYQAFIKYAPEGIFVADATGRYVEVNEAACRMTGYRAEELRQCRIGDLLLPACREEGMRHFERVRRDGHSVGELQFVHKDGSVYSMLIDAVKMDENSFVGFCRDTTDRVHLERSLARAQFALDHLPNMVLWVQEDGRLAYANQQVCETLGYQQREMGMLWIWDLDVALNTDRWTEKWQELRERDSFREERSLTGRHGEPVPVEALFCRLRHDDHEWACVVAVDRAERQKKQQEWEQLLRDLREKNEALERIVFVMSHDLRAPLANVEGYSRELEYAVSQVQKAVDSVPALAENSDVQAVLTRDAPESLHYIHRSIRKMDTMIGGLLRYSRLGRSHLTETSLDMDLLIRRMVDKYEGQIRDKNIRVEIGLLPPCYGDAERIEQVFANLFSNALKAVARSEEAQIKIYGYYSEQAVEFCVEDNGCGMGARQLDHVFDLFFTSGEKHNAALGLGLSIVKSIVEKHGGGVWAESRPQGGTKFTVRLPKTEYKTSSRRNEVAT